MCYSPMRLFLSSLFVSSLICSMYRLAALFFRRYVFHLDFFAPSLRLFSPSMGRPTGIRIWLYLSASSAVVLHLWSMLGVSGSAVMAFPVTEIIPSPPDQGNACEGKCRPSSNHMLKQ